MKTLVAFAIAAGVSGTSSIVYAQRSPNDAAAEALFEEGRKLLVAGDTKGACEKFAQSENVEHALGTLLNLAVCHEQDGRTATAWTEFAQARSEAARREDGARYKFALTHAASLESRLDRVAVDVIAPLEGMAITIDGKPLARDAWGTPIPFDPGVHDVAVSAPGKAPWNGRLEVSAQAGSERFSIPPLADAPPTSPPPPAPSLGVGGPSAHENESLTGRRRAGFIVGGVGAALLLTSGALALVMVADSNARSRDCPATTPCASQQAYTDAQAAYHAAQVLRAGSFVTLGVGVLALGTGVYLALPSRRASASAAQVRVCPVGGGAEVGLGGVW